jgi:hypothetical protein
VSGIKKVKILSGYVKAYNWLKVSVQIKLTTVQESLIMKIFARSILINKLIIALYMI